MDLKKVYSNRFEHSDRAAKEAVWQVLCHDHFQKYISHDDTVLDLGAGYCEFLKYIRCRERIAVDLNPEVSSFAPPGTKVIVASGHNLKDQCADNSVDIIFASNFFEHLPDKAILMATLEEIFRILSPGGKLLVLQPNIRILGGSYWDFIDHHIPITDRMLAEALKMVGLEVSEIHPRFLPYTTRSSIPKHPFLVRLYLKFTPIWQIMGGQFWLVAVKPPVAGSMNA
ncbi:MAG: class I SAM-dependent methyltransferase [bacterium]